MASVKYLTEGRAFKFDSLEDIVTFLRSAKRISIPEKQDIAVDALVHLLPNKLEEGLAGSSRDPVDAVADAVYGVEEALTVNSQDLDEQKGFQAHFPELKEVWVVARNFLDLGPFYQVVKENILKRNVTYIYFQPDLTKFSKLQQRLVMDLGESVRQHVWCVLAPEILFSTDFVIYNPGRQNMLGFVNRLEKGQTKRLYKMDPEQLEWVYEHVVRPIYNEFSRRKAAPPGEMSNILNFPVPKTVQ